MADDPTNDQADALRRRYQAMRRQYQQTLSPAMQSKRDFSELQALSAWAFRAGPTGWVLLRRGMVKLTNRHFDAFDRGCAIGPRWHVLPPGAVAPADDGPGHLLAEVVVDEARKLRPAPGPTSNRLRCVRGAMVVEVMLELSATSVTDTMVMATVRDVSDLAKSEAELAAMRARIMEKERLGLAGQLAIGVAHDLGNLVGALSARLMVLDSVGSSDLENVEALHAIAEAQAALVHRLKAMGSHRLDSGSRPVALLTDVVRPAVMMVESWLLHRDRHRPVRIRMEDDLETLPVVSAPRDELVNLLINLLINARDAMPEGGTIRIGGAVGGDGRVRLSVRDQGTGIPSKDLDQIFQPFFSTKGKNGLGMGLATARETMLRAGGDITARNLDEGGACFELAFTRPTEVAAAR
jgi:signal transduction histidine kinase